MARAVYTVTFSNVSVAAQATTTLVFINPGTNATIEILRCWVSQRANATSNQQGIQLSTQVTSFPTLVSATPAPTSPIDQASKITGNTTGAAGTCGVNASAEGAGGKTVLYADNFNVLNGWLWVPTPLETITFPGGSALAARTKFTAAPTALSNWTFGITYRELA